MTSWRPWEVKERLTVYRARPGGGEVCGYIQHVPDHPRWPGSGGWWLELGPLGSTRHASQWAAIAEARRRGLTTTARPAADVASAARPARTPTGKQRRASRSNAKPRPARKRTTTTRRKPTVATKRVYRCKGRTESGRIKKGWKLTKGGVVKAGRKRASTTRRKRSAPAAPTFAAAADLLAGRKPRAASKPRTRRKRAAPRPAAAAAPAAPRKLSAFRQITQHKHGAGVILVGSSGTAYTPQTAHFAGARERRQRLERAALAAPVAIAVAAPAAKPPAKSRRKGPRRPSSRSRQGVLFG